MIFSLLEFSFLHGFLLVIFAHLGLPFFSLFFLYPRFVGLFLLFCHASKTHILLLVLMIKADFRFSLSITIVRVFLIFVIRIRFTTFIILLFLLFLAFILVDIFFILLLICRVLLIIMKLIFYVSVLTEASEICIEWFDAHSPLLLNIYMGKLLEWSRNINLFEYFVVLQFLLRVSLYSLLKETAEWFVNFVLFKSNVGNEVEQVQSCQNIHVVFSEVVVHDCAVSSEEVKCHRMVVFHTLRNIDHPNLLFVIEEIIFT